MTIPNAAISDLWKALEELEDELMDLASALRGNLADWLTAVSRGELSLDELEALLEGEKALLEMRVLKKKVETKVLVSTLKSNLIDTLIEAVKKAL